MVGEKIYLVQVEDNIDGEIYFDTIPCSTIEIARKSMEEQKEFIRKKSQHFNGFSDNGEYEIEETEDKFYINDPSDDYYIYMWIVEKEIC